MVRNTRSFANAVARWARMLRGVVKTMLRQREPAALPPPAAASAAVEAKTPANVRKRNAAARKTKVAPPPLPPVTATPNCPHCRTPMVIKTARTGRNAGDFWGCVEYPKCRGIRPIFRGPSAAQKP